MAGDLRRDPCSPGSLRQGKWLVTSVAGGALAGSQTTLITDEDEEVVVGSREQLLHLLAEAAEIEHTLMCSYLYAAFSLKAGEEDGLSPDETGAVQAWRKTIMDVAVQEMGHLLMVANLAVAVGGRPHFSRPNFPIAPGYFPSGVVVRLTGFSRETIEHFIHLERPQGSQGEDSPAFQQDGYRREQVHLGLMPSTQDYTTIGHLYEAIRANILHLAERMGEKALFLGGTAAQVGKEIVDLPGVETIESVAAACTALDMIIEQGEGSPADRDDSHYHAFCGIRDELERLTEANPGFEPAWPVASNPVLRRPPEPDDKVFVDQPDAAELLDFACATYGLLLRVLVQSFSREGAAAAERQAALVSAAIDLMHVLGTAARQLARLPASTTMAGVNAGMSFTMLRGVEPLLPVSEARVLREQLVALARAARGIPGLQDGLETTLGKLTGELSSKPAFAASGVAPPVGERTPDSEEAK